MKKTLLSIRPLILLVLTNIIGMALIMIKLHEPDGNMATLCAIMCGLNLIVYIIVYVFSLGDSYLFLIVSMLSTIGVIMQSRIAFSDGNKHMVLYLAGVACFFVTVIVYRAFHKYWAKLNRVYICLSAVLFIITLVFAKTTKGAKNWIYIKGVSVQPSEFIRILFVMSLAAVLVNTIHKPHKDRTVEENKANLKYAVTVSVIAYMNMFFLLLQREWGTAVLFFAVFISCMYVYGENKPVLFSNIAISLLGGVVGCRFMSHIRTRVDVWKNPFKDASGAGYQIVQSLTAISSGGFAGSGVGNGRPDIIPAVESDFIFSAICEEMGTLGAIAVILLYFMLVYRGFKIALSCTNAYNKIVSTGLSVMLGVQTFIIVGGVIKLIPLTGITLPFISLGGSSMISTFIVIGILQAISGMKGEVTDEIE